MLVVNPILSYGPGFLQVRPNENLYQKQIGTIQGLNEYVRWTLSTDSSGPFTLELSHNYGDQTTVMLSGNVPEHKGTYLINARIKASVQVVYGYIMPEPAEQEITFSIQLNVR
jgi:hypothetical protein